MYRAMEINIHIIMHIVRYIYTYLIAFFCFHSQDKLDWYTDPTLRFYRRYAKPSDIRQLSFFFKDFMFMLQTSMLFFVSLLLLCWIHFHKPLTVARGMTNIHGIVQFVQMCIFARSSSKLLETYFSLWCKGI